MFIDLIKSNEDKLLPNDRILDFRWDEARDTGFGNYSQEPPGMIYYPVMVVSRSVEETDDEYFKRMKRNEDNKKAIEQKEKLEYLRLKAKYENDGI
jgi:hypothetical protein